MFYYILLRLAYFIISKGVGASTCKDEDSKKEILDLKYWNTTPTIIFILSADHSFYFLTV